ncbi:MAG: TonB-dependent receptor [Chitinophagaceae bacterium]
MRKLLLFLSLIFTAQLLAQNRTITGRVTDANGNPLPNVSVIVKGENAGVSTQTDGSFSLNASPNAKTLVFSSVGFADEEVNINNRTAITISLSSRQRDMEEVVVVAYGTAKKSTYTGSVAQIDNKAFERRPITNVINALAGAAPGVQVNSGSGQPGAAPTIRIRGIGSINASNNPLYVVDGVPYSGTIANLNPDDVQSITVAKDASASSLYGSRAANGVVMITTKRGRNGRNQMHVNVMKGVSSRALPEYDKVNAFEYYPVLWEAYRNSLAYSSTTPIEQASQTATTRIKGLLGYNPFNVRSNDIVRTDGTINPNASLLYPDDLDWAKPLMRNGNRSNYTMSFNGGAEKSDYYISLGYVNEKGFTIKSDYERFTGRINLNTQPTTWFKTGLNLSGTVTKSNQANTGSSTAFVNPFNFSRNMGPIYPVYAHDTLTGQFILDRNGEKIYDLGNMTSLGLPNRSSGGSPGRHGVAETNYNDNLFKRNVLSGRTYGEMTFLKNFKFTTNVSIDISNFLESTYDNNIVGDGAPAGRASRTNEITTSYTFNQLLNFNKSFGNHNLDVLAGHENFDWTFNTLEGSVSQQIVEGNTELVNFTIANSLPESRTDKHKIESYLSRIRYGYADKYYAEFTYRRDGSSKFSKDFRWGDFWSVSGGWRLDGENFMQNVNWVNLLKVRASYGLVGNDAILTSTAANDYYPAQGLYTLGSNNASEPGFILQNLANQNLLWETNKTFGAAIEFAILNNRINGTFEFFHRQSDNLLFSVPLPISTGVLSTTRNIGTMYNRGFEFQLGVDIVRTRHFNWNINANATTYTNRITKLPQTEIISGTKKLKVGESVYEFWLREWMGVDPQDGVALYRANAWSAGNSRITKSGDSVSTSQNNARFHYAGSAIPEVTGGITNTLTFKSFDVSFLITYQIGGKVYDATYAGLMSSGSYGAALHKDILGRWQKPGDVAEIPRMDVSQTAAFGAASDRWLTDASFMNVRTVNIGYNLPKAYTSKVRIQNARFYLSGENLYFHSKRKGMNTGQNYAGVFSNYGVLTNVYMPARILSAGLNITL